MYCVVQVLQRRKPNQHGAYREYEVQSMTLKFQDGTIKTNYSYYPKSSAGRFERPYRESYKISIHESRRENGRVVKKQCAIGTIGYYELIQWGLYDYINRGVSRAVEMFGADYDVIYNLVESKMQPIMEKVIKEYHKSDEYKAEKKLEKIRKAYEKAKRQFGKKYGVDPNEYDYCYNIFGELMDENYLNQIIRQQEAKRSYQEKWRSTYERYTSRDYQSSGGSTYSGQSTGDGSYSVPSYGNYTDDEKKLLKEFYRTLSKKFHPDLNPDRDTTEIMKLINKLKEQWRL